MAALKFAETYNLVAFLSKPKESDGFEQIVNFLNANPINYALTVNPTIYTSCIEQFWTTTKVKTINGECTDCLPTATIFEELTRMGAKTTAWNEFSSTMASAIICLATNQKINFSKYIFDNMVKNLEGGVKFLMYPRFVQVFVNQQLGDMSHHKMIFVTPSHTKKVFGNIKREGKGFSGRVTPLFQIMMVQPQEEMGEVLALETTKTNQALEIDSLIRRVKKLEKKASKRTHKLKRLYKGRKIADIDADAEVTLIDETQGRNDDLVFDTGVFDGEEVFAGHDKVENVVSTAEVTTDSATITTVDELTRAQTLIEIKAVKPKDKGKAKMIEPEEPLKKKDQIMYDQEVALKLQTELQAELEQEEKLERQKEDEANIALIESWDNIQAKIDADYQMAQ
ncbi:hypothetical protein Tco_0355592 [Tanacetum coccineum]